MAFTGGYPGGRLTLTSGLPVTVADVTAAANVFYCPYVSDVLTLWDGSAWSPTVFTEQTLAVAGAAGLNFDVFGFLNAGAVNIESLQWASDTARTTGISLQGGRYCKTGDKTRLYLGTFRTSGVNVTEDSGGGSVSQVGGKRFLWNLYNQIRRKIAVIDTTDSWAYTTNTIRQANGATGNKVEFVLGLEINGISALIEVSFFLNANNAQTGNVGFGLDSITAYVAGNLRGELFSAGQLYNSLVSFFSSNNLLGYHYLAWLETGASAGSCSFLGDDGGECQSGIFGELFA